MKVSFELEIVSQKVDRFGWGQMNEAIRTRLIADWTAVLDDYPLGEIRSAISELLANDPKSAMNERQVAKIIQREHGRRLAQVRIREPEPESVKERMTNEEAERIVREAGFSIKRMGEKE